MLRKKPSQLLMAGVSLIEVSIVLGIVGTIIGGVWVVMAGGRESSRAATLQQQTIMTVRNIRDYYGGRALPTGVVGETTASTFTGTLRAAGVFPEDMCPANCVSGTVTTILNVYSGATLVSIVNTAPYSTFNINFAQVAKRGCVALAMNLGARSTELGIVSFQANGGTVRSSFPVASSTIDSDCSSATANTVDVVFRIRS